MIISFYCFYFSLIEKHETNVEPQVEFFDPKLYGKDHDERRKAGKGTQDEWVWLTSYSRIPVSVFQLLNKKL